MFWKKKPKKQSKTSAKVASDNTSKVVIPATPKTDVKHEPKIRQEFKTTVNHGLNIARGLSDGLDCNNQKSEPLIKYQHPEKDFLKVFEQLTYRHRAWTIWQDFVIMFACSLSNPVDKSHYDEREAFYMQTIKKYNKNEMELFPLLFAHLVRALEYNPEQDFLGEIFIELELGDDHKKQIFTPYSVCQCMAAISLGDIVSQVKEKGYITISDPCCGAGATLIASINEAKRQLHKEGLNFQNHVLIAAQDIEDIVALMCYIQLSILGVAAYIKIGNSLTEPMASNDTMENYWFTPMYFSQVWTFRRIFHGGKL